MNKYSYNVNKNTIEKYGQFFAYVNVIDANRIVKSLNEQDKLIGELKNSYKTIDNYKDYEKKYQKRIKELEKRIIRLEEKEQNKEKDNIIWALNQFRYKEKTEDERKAFCIIDSILNAKW